LRGAEAKRAAAERALADSEAETTAARVQHQRQLDAAVSRGKASTAKERDAKDKALAKLDVLRKQIARMKEEAQLEATRRHGVHQQQQEQLAAAHAHQMNQLVVKHEAKLATIERDNQTQLEVRPQRAFPVCAVLAHPRSFDVRFSESPREVSA